MRLKKVANLLKHNQEGRTLASNFAYLTLLQVAGYLFPLLTLPYLARVIGAEGFGKIAFASAIIIWVQTICDWGFDYTATRDVAKNRNDKVIVSAIFSQVLWSRCALMLFAFTILAIATVIVPPLRETTDIILVTFLLVPGHILFPEWFFQALERMKYITLLNLLSKLIFTGAIFIFIKEKEDYLLQPLFISLGYIVSGIIALYFILGRWGYSLQRPKFSIIKQAISRSSDVFISNIAPNLYNSFTTILLGLVGGDVANGKFDAGNRLVALVQRFIAILSRVFFPFLSRRIEKFPLLEHINWTIGILASLTLFLLSPWAINLLFTPEFEDSVVVMRILSISILFIVLTNTYGTNYLLITGHEHELRNITLTCSIVGFFLSFPLIYFHGLYGAAFTICCTRGILAFSSLWLAKRFTKST